MKTSHAIVIAGLASFASISCAAGKNIGGGTATGDDTTGAADSGTTGDDTATGTSTTTSTETDSGSTTTTSTPDLGTPPSGCSTLAGPFGAKTGETLNPAINWQGYDVGSSTIGTVKLSDLYDCDGSKGINAIVLDTSGVWCPNCKTESSQFETVMRSTWAGLGVRVIVLMAQNASKGPPSMSDVDNWKRAYMLTDVAVVLDSTGVFLPIGTFGMPYNMLVNPRNLQVVTIAQGVGGDMNAVVARFASDHKKR